MPAIPTLAKTLLLFGSVSMGLVVALGAFGAHALKPTLTPEHWVIYQTAVQYQAWHALGLLVLGLLARQWPDSRALRWAGGLMAVGLLLFCGSLYALSLTGLRSLGAITPLGGVAWLMAWLVLAVAVMRTD